MPKILVIDDAETVCKLITVIFSRYPDFKIFTANNLEDGMLLLLNEMPDIALLDVHLPGKRTGIDLYAAIKKNPGMANVHPILMTGSEFKDLINFTLGDTLGDQTPYIVKPFGAEKLINYVLEELGLV